jgi:predicted NAD/FAD-dependent oxidoreductase
VQRSDNGIWLAGDACANSSVNAALMSGRLVAEAIAAG